MTREATDVGDLGDGATPEPETEQGDLVEDLQLAPEAGPVDLSVMVQRRDDGERRFTVAVQSRHLEEYSSPRIAEWELEVPPAELVASYMDEFSRAGLSPEGRLGSLVGAGKYLFEASPEHFQEALRLLVERGAPLETVLVASSERHIPWELMVPTEGSGAELSPRAAPLGASLNVARWFDSRLDPPSPAPFADARVVAPTPTGYPPLPRAANEEQLVRASFGGKLLTPARIAVLDAGLDVWNGTLLHFVCHGEQPTSVSQRLVLDDGDELTSTMLRGLDGVRRGLSAGRAFVFINACKAAGMTPTLTGSGGFPSEFIAQGARAVIAPLWNVDDEVAFEVATEFYDQVRNDPAKPFGAIVRDIRRRAYDHGTPSAGQDTWAAYCYYGDPLLAAV